MKVRMKAKPPTEDYSSSTALIRMKARIEAMKIRLPPRPMNRHGAPLDPYLPSDLTILNDVLLEGMKVVGE